MSERGMCGTCKYFDGRKVIDQGLGQCRKGPPVSPWYDDSGRYCGLWPPVNPDDDYCGEHRPAMIPAPTVRREE